MLETDQAREVFERLEDCYFNQANLASNPTAAFHELLRNSRALVSFDERLNPQINILPPTGLIVDPFDYDSVLNLTKSSIPVDILQALIVKCVEKLASNNKQ